MMDNAINIGALDTFHIHANDCLRVPQVSVLGNTLIPAYTVVAEIFRNDPELIFLGVQSQEVPVVLRVFPLFSVALR